MILRAFQEQDADIICKWITSEADLYRWSGDRFNRFPLSAADILENYAPQIEAGRFFPFCAEDADGRLIGHFIIRYPKADDNRTVRFGFVIVDPAYRGKGCGRSMLRLGIRFAQEHLHAERISLGVFTNNEPARRCYEALGFRAYSSGICKMPVGSWECTDMELFLQ